MGNLWLMRDCVRDWRGLDPLPAPTDDERRSVLMRHAELQHACRGDYGLIEFRKHSVRYLAGMHGARAARGELVLSTSLDEIRDILNRHFGPETSEAAAYCAPLPSVL